ncbi:hypothetical protein [Methylorubrum populi]|nr:hypothetical protein [Methylorubrum populi]
MEYLIRDFARYGDLLVLLSTTEGEIDGEVLRLIGFKMAVDGENLNKHFDDALKLFPAEARR